MRFTTVVCAILPIASFAMSAVSAMALETEIECYPGSTTIRTRDYHVFEERSASQTLAAFIAYLRANAGSIKKSPVFWTGRYNRKGAKAAADIFKKNNAIVGAAGGHTVFDAVKDANIDTTGWTAANEWSEACGAFAELAKPTSEHAFLVYGPTRDPLLNIWNNKEWPGLQKNAFIKKVTTYKMGEDGKVPATEAGVEIKASGKGNHLE